MIKQFYEKALPTQGVYCIAGIDKNKKITQRFAETLDDLVFTVNHFKQMEVNVYVALASFEGYSRKAVDAQYLKSFFIDLDVGADKAADSKGYLTKEAAKDALGEFIHKHELPPPVVVDSGTGIHAYWIFEEQVAATEWKPYAQKFKDFFLSNGLFIDPAVTADTARILRCPDTLNYKTVPPSPASVIDEDWPEYSFDCFKDFLGVEDVVPTDVLNVLKAAPKGLDPDTLALLKRDNFEKSFNTIAVNSLEENPKGCAQIKAILLDAKTLPEPLWYAGLSIAVRCEDGEEAIHDMSEDYPGYNRAYTIKKAQQSLNEATGPHTCETFNALNSGLCGTCPNRGKVTSPLQLGQRLKTPKHTEASEESAKENTVRVEPDSQAIPVVPVFPKFMFPFSRGVTGGIYYTPPPKRGKDGKSTQDDPIQITSTDVFPIKRMRSALDGECLLMVNLTPNDPYREFILPMKDTYAMENFKKIMTTNSVLPPVGAIQHLMNYVIKWGQYLLGTIPAEEMRMQMGWTEDNKYFVIGNTEIGRDGTERKAPSSPFVRGLAKHLKPVGTKEKWRTAANMLDRPEFNMHAFGMLCGFGSPLMHHTSTSGVCVSFTGKTGAAKTGAMYGGLSVFGNPKELSVFDATENGMIGRYLGMHNLLLGCDEVTNKDSEALSQLIHRVSHGKAKIRMQASVNAEREYEMSASIIAVFTNNEPVMDKLERDKAIPEGEAARMIEFHLPVCALLKTDSQIGRDIFDTFRTNYGHAGPDYVKYLMSVGDEYIIAKVDKWTRRFIEQYGSSSANRFRENLAGATFAGGELAIEAGVITLNLDRVYNEFMMYMIQIRDKTVKDENVDYEALVAEFLIAHHHGLLIMDGSKVLTEPRNALVGRVEVHSDTTYIAKKLFKEYLSKQRISTREFEYALHETKALMPGNLRERLTKGWRAGMSTDPIAVYGFRSKIPQELLSDIAKPS